MKSSPLALFALVLVGALLLAATVPTPATAAPPAKVEIYVTSWCPYCTKAKAFLRANNIPFIEYDIEKDRAAGQRRTQLESRGGVPLLVVDDKKLVGFSESAYRQLLGLNK